MNEKKLRKSPVTIILFVLAAIMLVYTLYLVGSTIAYIINYYAQYGMSPQIGESVGYVLQAVYQPLSLAALLGAAAFILKEVRALNPANYVTKEELEAAKAAKKAVKNATKEVEVETAEAKEEANEEVAEEAKEEVAEEVAEETEEEKNDSDVHVQKFEF